MAEIRSAETMVLTTPRLIEFKELVEETVRTRKSLTTELSSARREELKKSKRMSRWTKGWLLRRIFNEKYDEIQAAAEEVATRVLELEEKERVLLSNARIEVAEVVMRSFKNMCSHFEALSKCDRIWDVLDRVATDRIAERTTARHSIEKKVVHFGFGQCELISCDVDVPHLQNANGGDIYLYPAFVLYFQSVENFAMLEHSQLNLELDDAIFLECGAFPKDAEQFGQAWEKANTDGSPDRRFKENRQIPIARYGGLKITAPTGLNEHYHFSSRLKLANFVAAYKDFARTVFF